MIQPATLYLWICSEDALHKQFNEKILEGEFQLSENVLIRRKVPQLDVL